MNLKISLTNLQTQQEIINVIEPFEELFNKLDEKLKIINNIIISTQYNIKKIGIMIENEIIFEKGKNINNSSLSINKTNLLFINVSAINNKNNKWIINESLKNNIEYGDVLLTLDGTLGLVNNFLKGFNGYGYKVHSKKIKNYQIYYSLKHFENQIIINENANGSVIKHATKAKEKLILFNYSNDFFKNLYYLEINLKAKIKIIKKLINLLIELCI